MDRIHLKKDMKYGNIIFDGNRKTSFNIGDDIQLVAIENLYDYMGIEKKDRVRLNFSELPNYDGEYVILPIAFPLYGYKHELYITMFSEKIIPVFLSLSIMSGKLSDEEIIYLRRFEPIGCRDYHTVKLLRNNNIMSYLNGCMTITLPRAKELKGDKIYFVDVPSRYYQYIPENIRDGAIKLTNVLDDCENPEDEIRNRLSEYINNASMIVTTRLHCALPCIAMGIPVVFMKDRYSFRFPVVSRYIHVWEKDEFELIDWNPTSVNIEKEKTNILEVAKKRIEETYQKYSSIFDLSWFYEEDNLREKYYIEHVDNVLEMIDNNFAPDEHVEYAIWGITQKSDLICDYIEKNRPNFQLKYVFDKTKKVLFHGVLSGNDYDILKEKDVFVFVTTATANLEAIDLFTKLGKDNYSISADDIERLDK